MKRSTVILSVIWLVLWVASLGKALLGNGWGTPAACSILMVLAWYLVPTWIGASGRRARPTVRAVALLMPVAVVALFAASAWSLQLVSGWAWLVLFSLFWTGYLWWVYRRACQAADRSAAHPEPRAEQSAPELSRS